MRRDNNTENNHLYGLHYSVQPAPLSFVSIPPKARPYMKQSLNLDSSQHDYLNNNIKRYQPSIESNSFATNNNYSHLRSEITNLRTEFSRLIQKEVNSPKMKEQQTSVKVKFQQKMENTLPFYSPFDHHGSGRVASDNHKQNGIVAFKNRLLKEQRLTSELENGSINKLIKKDDEHPRVAKVPSKNILKNSQIEITEINYQNTIGELKGSVIKLTQQKDCLQSQISELKKRFFEKQTEYSRQNQLLAYDLKKQKKISEQTSINLSLMNRLVQKLQNEQQKRKNQIDSLQKRLNESQQQIIRIKDRHESQIASLENTNKKNMNNIIQKYRQTEQQLQKMTAILLVKQKEISKKINQIEQLKNKGQSQKINQKKDITAICQALTKANNSLKGQVQISQHKIHQLKNEIEFLKKSNSSNVNFQKNINQNILSGSRLKQNQQESIDLRKRNESYKKTIEQLNSSNNTAREKQHILKEENKLFKEENKMLKEQIFIKENLIAGLYRDINILDNELRSCNNIKNQLSCYSKCIEQLNNCIIVLQFQRINGKYFRA